MFSSLLCYSDSEKDFNLLNTSKITLSKDLCTTDSKHIYFVTDKLKKFTIYPFKMVLEKECQLKIEKILIIKNEIICIGEGRLIKNFSENIFLDEKVLELLEVENFIGVQFINKLILYNLDLIKVKEYKCNTSFYLEGILILGNKNNLQVIAESSLDIFLEDDITCITSDVLFTKIFCGSSSGKIYQINMDGSPNKVLDYHESSVKFLKMSVCNRFLYSVDINSELLIWEDIVIDRIKLNNIKGIEVYI